MLEIVKSKLIVYTLVDPRTGKPFYVGKSTNGFEKGHRHTSPRELRVAAHTPKGKAISEMLAAGVKPECWPIAWCSSKRELEQVETAIIRQWTRTGYELTNSYSMGNREIVGKIRPGIY